MKTERENLKACAEFEDRLVDLSDGELADDPRHLVEAHIAECAHCRAELARLDASLAMLRRTGFQPVHPTVQASADLRRTIYYSTALSLVLLLAAGFAALSFLGNADAPQTARVATQQDAIRSAHDPQPDMLHEAAVLRQIALIEQQARIQASLDLMPKDPWFAEQRAANEELLAKFKALAEVSITGQSAETQENDSGDTGETL